MQTVPCSVPANTMLDLFDGKQHVVTEASQKRATFAFLGLGEDVFQIMTNDGPSPLLARWTVSNASVWSGANTTWVTGIFVRKLFAEQVRSLQQLYYHSTAQVFEASSQCVATSYDSKFSETDEKAFKEMITPVLCGSLNVRNPLRECQIIRRILFAEVSGWTGVTACCGFLFFQNTAHDPVFSLNTFLALRARDKWFEGTKENNFQMGGK